MVKRAYTAKLTPWRARCSRTAGAARSASSSEKALREVYNFPQSLLHSTHAYNYVVEINAS